MASKLFSTAVISGSKSLPNLVADDKCHSKFSHFKFKNLIPETILKFSMSKSVGC